MRANYKMDMQPIQGRPTKAFSKKYCDRIRTIKPFNMEGKILVKDNSYPVNTWIVKPKPVNN